METKFQTSFIPKKPVATTITDTGDFRAKPNILGLITTIIFLASILITGVVFLLVKFTNDTIIDQQNTITKDYSSFQKSLIDEATKLDDRMESIKTLLNNHVAPTEFFALLEENTLKTVSFSGLTISRSDSGLIKLKASGIARNAESIVAQSDKLGASQKFKDVIFSGVNISDQDLASFVFEASLDPKVLSYLNKVATNLPQPNNSSATSTNNNN